ncbi:MAG: tRNA pseudouridine(54/55) synthase Pus10 [Halodesulfurarchaeum sp.]
MTLLSDAAAVIEAGPVCAPCLGRCFADRSFGLSNRERGKALRVAVAMAEDEPYDPPSTCWVCEGKAERFEEWAERAVEQLEGITFESYQVGTRTPPLIEENERLLREDAGLEPDAGEAFKSECNREVGKAIGRATGTEVDFDRPDVQLLVDIGADEVTTQINSAFVYGRYRKLERGIPQTKWPCQECNGTGEQAGEPCIHCDGTGFRYPESVEQLTVPPVVEAMDGSEGTFHGAGREDIDARMLGTGRPFVIEVEEPRDRFPDQGALQADINAFANGAVEVEGIRLATYEMVERVKELAASKTYRTTVEFADPIEADELQGALSRIDGATVEQETPQRVSHRRAAKVRERTVYDIDGELVDETHAEIEIHGEGGLYVKELVDGDAGRTEPSLAGLLETDAHVTALDVIAVEGEDEPFEDEAFFRSPPD